MSSFLGGGIGASGAPGSLSPFATGVANQAAGQGVNAMINRYNQLGMGGSTPELQDIGQLPSLTGGIPAQGNALIGQLQTNALGSPSGVSNSPATLIGGAGQLANLLK